MPSTEIGSHGEKCGIFLQRVKWAVSLLVVLAILADSGLAAQDEASDESRTARLRADVSFLADDSLRGRDAFEETSRAAARFLRSRLVQLGLRPLPGNDGEYLIPFTYKERTLENVAGWLPGTSDEVVILGAHYDHIGEGRFGGAKNKDPEDSIYNGANDNASGTAGVLEMVRHLMQVDGLKRGLVVVLFSEEEKGLLGSKDLAGRLGTLLPGKKPVAMVNLDMIGLFGGDTIDMFGVGTSPAWPKILNSVSLMKWRDYGYIPNSDHHPFYLRKIPVVFPFCGLDADYHGTNDEKNKLNYEKMSKVCLYMSKICENILKSDQMLEFKEVDRKTMLISQTRVFGRVRGVRLGVSFSDRATLVVGEVFSATRAEELGMKADDRLIAVNGQALEGLKDFRDTLESLKSSSDIKSLDVLRSGELVTLTPKQ